MLLPMFGFIFALLVVGGLANLVAVADPRHARFALYLGFTSLFAGIGALCLSLGLALSLGYVLGSDWWSGPGFFGGYAVGLVGGSVLGFRRAYERQRRVEAANE
jgi:hypothetical protein